MRRPFGCSEPARSIGRRGHATGGERCVRRLGRLRTAASGAISRRLCGGLGAFSEGEEVVAASVVSGGSGGRLVEARSERQRHGVARPRGRPAPARGSLHAAGPRSRHSRRRSCAGSVVEHDHVWLSLRSLDERGGAALPAFSADRGDLHRLVEAPFELGVGRAQGATVRSAADDDVEVTPWRTGGDEEPFAHEPMRIS
jgi:hypothetical protein